MKYLFTILFIVRCAAHSPIVVFYCSITLSYVTDLLSGSPRVASVHKKMTVGSTESAVGTNSSGSSGGAEYTCPHGHQKHHPTEPTRRRSETTPERTQPDTYFLLL